MCCQEGNLDCLEYLLSIEPQFNVSMDKNRKEKEYGMTPLLVAMNENHTSVVNLLLDRFGNELFSGKDCDKNGKNLFWFCCMNGNIDICKKLIQLYQKEIVSNISKCDSEGKSGLYIACEYNRFDFVHYLLHESEMKQVVKEKLLNLAEGYGYTPLMAAADEGHLQIVKLLCDLGSQTKIVEMEDDDGYNAIDLAVVRGNAAVFSR